MPLLLQNFLSTCEDFSVCSVPEQSNTEATEALCGLCVYAFEARRTQRILSSLGLQCYVMELTAAGHSPSLSLKKEAS